MHLAQYVTLVRRLSSYGRYIYMPLCLLGNKIRPWMSLWPYKSLRYVQLKWLSTWSILECFCHIILYPAPGKLTRILLTRVNAYPWEQNLLTQFILNNSARSRISSWWIYWKGHIIVLEICKNCDVCMDKREYNAATPVDLMHCLDILHHCRRAFAEEAWGMATATSAKSSGPDTLHLKPKTLHDSQLETKSLRAQKNSHLEHSLPKTLYATIADRPHVNI